MRAGVSPENALHVLADHGHTEALLAGGAAAYHSFLAHDLVDELILNVAPALTAMGSHLSLTDARSTSLRLVELRRLGQGEAQLRYQISR